MRQDFDEQAWLAEQARFEHEEEQRELEEYTAQITAFQKVCTQKGITLTKEHFTYVQTIGGIVATYPGLVSLIYPELPSDKDGLSDFWPRITDCYSNSKHRAVLCGEQPYLF